MVVRTFTCMTFIPAREVIADLGVIMATGDTILTTAEATITVLTTVTAIGITVRSGAMGTVVFLDTIATGFVARAVILTLVGVGKLPGYAGDEFFNRVNYTVKLEHSHGREYHLSALHGN